MKGRIATDIEIINSIEIVNSVINDYCLTASGEAYAQETLDSVIPDSFPDAESIAAVWVNAAIKNRECKSGRAVVTGTAKACIIYEAADSSGYRSVIASIPIAAEYQSPAIEQDDIIIAVPWEITAEGKVINSRKLQVKLNAAYNVSVFSKRELKLCTGLDSAEPLEIRSDERQIFTIKDVKDKTFTVNDVLKLESGKPAIDTLLAYSVSVGLLEKKMVENKLIIKGELYVSVIYNDTALGISSESFTLPFSQIIELDTGDSDDNCMVWLTLANTELEVDDDYSESLDSFNIKVGIMAQVYLYGAVTLPVISDFYGLSGISTSASQPIKCQQLLDSYSSKASAAGSASFDEPAKKILGIAVNDGKKEYKRDGGNLTVYYHADANAVYMTESGRLISKAVTAEAQLRQELAKDAELLTDCTFQKPQFDISGSSLRLEIPTEINIAAITEQSFQNLTEARVEQGDEEKGKCSAVIIKDNKMDIWELGKVCKARRDRIEAVNSLEPGESILGKTLIIPRGKGRRA